MMKFRIIHYTNTQWQLQARSDSLKFGCSVRQGIVPGKRGKGELGILMPNFSPEKCGKKCSMFTKAVSNLRASWINRKSTSVTWSLLRKRKKKRNMKQNRKTFGASFS